MGSTEISAGDIRTPAPCCPHCGGPMLPQRRWMRVADVIDVVSAHYGIPAGLLSGPDKHPERIRPRRIAMLIARRNLGFSIRAVARAMNRDESTVRGALDLIEFEVLRDGALRAEVDSLAAVCRARWAR